MIGAAQFGIVIGALGGVLTLMGIFPGITGIVPGRGVGLVQFFALMGGVWLLHLGAILYVKYTLYPRQNANLAQQVSVRLTLTALVLAAFTGLADYLGFGSHGIEQGSDSIFFGPLQAGVVLILILIAAVGVLLYAVSGSPPTSGDGSGSR